MTMTEVLIPTITFHQLTVANLTRRVEWHGQNTEQWNLVDWSNELAGEVGEACNLVKKVRRVTTGVRGRGPRSESELLEALRLECADVAICVDLLCTAAGFNLGDAVLEKFNQTSRKHGLKTFLS